MDGENNGKTPIFLWMIWGASTTPLFLGNNTHRCENGPTIWPQISAHRPKDSDHPKRRLLNVFPGLDFFYIMVWHTNKNWGTHSYGILILNIFFRFFFCGTKEEFLYPSWLNPGVSGHWLYEKKLPGESGQQKIRQALQNSLLLGVKARNRTHGPCHFGARCVMMRCFDIPVWRDLFRSSKHQMTEESFCFFLTRWAYRAGMINVWQFASNEFVWVGLNW